MVGRDTVIRRCWPRKVWIVSTEPAEARRDDIAQRQQRDGGRDGRQQRAAAGEQRRDDAVHLAGDGRARHRDQAVLAVAVGDQVDETGLVGHGDLAELRERRIQPRALAKHQGRGRIVPDDVGAVGVDRLLVAE